MRIPSLAELMRLTRPELLMLLRDLEGAMAALPSGSPDRERAMAGLTKIRWALARPGLTP